MINIETSEIFTWTVNSTKRVIVHEGSARSSKTISILQFLIYKALSQKINITICRARHTWCRQTVIPDFIWVLDSHFKMYDPEKFNKTESIYTFPNGSLISFIGLDEENKLRGRKQNIAYINEAIESDYESFQQLAIRTMDQLILDYNPSEIDSWIYDKVIPRNDCDFFKSTFLQNPFLQKDIKDEILRLEPTEINIRQGTADAVAWAVFGLGQRAAHKGLIYKFNIVKELPPKEEWKRYFYGLDFGFTNDPTALILVVLAHGELYFKQMIFETRLTNIRNPENPEQISIQQRLEELGIEKTKEIWADSSEPKSIQDLKNVGYWVKPVEKGADSVNAGIDTVKRYKLNVTEDSLDLIKEFKNYKWKEKDGKALNEPLDLFNHGMDALRYACYMELKRSDKKLDVYNPLKIEIKGTLQERLSAEERNRENESYFR